MSGSEQQAHSIFRAIQTHGTQAGSAGRKVGMMILEEPGSVIHYSVSEFASRVGVSEATVVRFCQNLGFKGYQDFKIQLSQALVTPVKSLDRNIEPNDPPKTLMEKICNTAKETIDDTLQVINEEHLEQAVRLVANARRILFFGLGASGIVAEDAEHKFIKLGLNVTAHKDPHTAQQACSVLAAQDLVFVISYSGASREVVSLVKLAKDRNAKVLAISRFGKTPLSRLADVILATSSPESEYRSEAISSRVAQLCIIDSLFVAVYMSDEKRFEGPLQIARAALSDSKL